MENKQICISSFPSNTPWGAIQTLKQIAPGLCFVTTASHGGFWLSPERFKEMPECLRKNTFAGGPWFEEDCDWALVVVAFRQFFPAEEVEVAYRTMIHFHPEKLAAFKAGKWVD